MGSPYVFVIDGYTFPRPDVPALGPLTEFNLRRWIEQDVIGTADPGTILTMIGTRSPRWPFVSRACEATRDKLVAVYAGETVVNFKTPDNPTTGFDVIMTRLLVHHRTAIAGTRSLCEFTLMKR